MKISKLTDYAVCILLTIAQKDVKHISAADIAEDTGFPLPTVSKILKALTRKGLVKSVLGAGGGYYLSDDIANFSIADAVVAMEGEIQLTSCVDGCCETCDYTDTCLVEGKWDHVNNAVISALKSVKLVDLVGQ